MIKKTPKNDFSKLTGTLSAMADVSNKVKPLYSPAQNQGSAYKTKSSTYSGVPTYANLSNLGTVTTTYGGSTRYEKFHPAVDIANKIGTPIPAFKGGKVVDIVTGKKQGEKGYGNYVMVVDDQGNKWRYSHLNESYVKVGQSISQGTVLGLMGNSGSTYSNSGGTGSHLDLRIMNAYNKYIDPTPYITAGLKSNKT